MAERPTTRPDKQQHTRDFDDPRLVGRRLFAETFGMFFLVLVACGGPVVDAKSGGQIGLPAQTTAPGLMVMVLILFLGEVSGAHLNPVVSVAFALRGDFPWRRIPPYVGAQLLGAVLAAGALRAAFGTVGDLGRTELGPGVGVVVGVVVEAVLTLGLVTTILGGSSGARNIGGLSALAVGGYIVLAGLWSAPLTGPSMNPARSLGPAIVSGTWTDWWVFLLGPFVGGVTAVGVTWILQGPGGRPKEKEAAQGRA
jgi:aquaporin Z